MRLVCFFEDTVEMLEHRKEFGKKHLEYLKENAAEILIGGGLRDKSEDVYVGGLWIMEVKSFERAKELVENDPYYVPEFRKYRLLVWGKAFDEPVVL